MTRESFAVLEESTGQQYRFGMPGPMLKEEEVQLALEEVASSAPDSGFLVASGSLPPGRRPTSMPRSPGPGGRRGRR